MSITKKGGSTVLWINSWKHHEKLGRNNPHCELNIIIISRLRVYKSMLLHIVFFSNSRLILHLLGKEGAILNQSKCNSYYL